MPRLRKTGRGAGTRIKPDKIVLRGAYLAGINRRNRDTLFIASYRGMVGRDVALRCEGKVRLHRIREIPISLLGVTIAMNKADFIGAVSTAAELSKADAGRAVDAVIETIKKALKKGDSVSLVGFGTFVVRKRAARTGRNPRTGDTIKIKASKNPSFKAGKALKDAVN